MPITIEPIGPTKPAAGVMATRPATAPEAPPSIEGLPLLIHSPKVQDSTAAQVASRVLTKASAAEPLASSAEPALKPNQPNHSSEAPTMVKVRLCGRRASRPKPIRLPNMKAPTRPATAALMCTTVPPAKSSAPFWNSQPPLAVAAVPAAASVYRSGPGQNQTIWAIGMYEKVNHSTTKTSTAENLARSAKAPMIRPQVMAAKAHWKAK